ncbi:MAG: succinate dehydrogenase, hydrophobic membrane anchor protein [Neomegalonema sp.]|nr:succinate dehydrogenase, hydrophobic membrane anchor protein [Neomegalonema sp.]
MTSANSDLRTPANRVLGLGSAKDGVGHWWAQRLSSVALIPLTFLFVIPLAGVIGEGFDAVRALYQQPYHAIIAILFLAVTFWHHQQGLQVVIEDYVHGKGSRTIMLVLNSLVTVALAVIGIFSVAKIAFGG